MSSNLRAELVQRIGQAVQAFQDATDAFDEAAAARLGVNRTDLRCLSVIAARQPISVGEVGRAVSLTRGAATTALDRVERKGLARRVRDPHDRRGVLLEMTEKARQETRAIWEPVAAAGARMLCGYSEAELAAILRFLHDARAVQLDNLPDDAGADDASPDDASPGGA